MAFTSNGARVIATAKGEAFYSSPDLVENVIPGTDGLVYEGGLLRGDVDVVLRYVGAYWHKFIEPIVKHWDATLQKWVPQCWAYALRAKRGQTAGFSEHAAAVATDTNSARHPQHRYTLTMAQRLTLAKLAVDLDYVVGFGAFWSDPDEMHAEVVKFGEPLANLAADIRAGRMEVNFPELVTNPDPPKPAPAPAPAAPAKPAAKPSNPQPIPEEDFVRAIYFKYFPDDGEVVAAAAAGRPRPADRIFESNGAEFWHVPRADTLKARLAFLAQIGVKASVVVNGRVIDATGIDSITGAPIVPDPHVYGREIGSAT